MHGPGCFVWVRVGPHGVLISGVPGGEPSRVLRAVSFCPNYWPKWRIVPDFTADPVSLTHRHVHTLTLSTVLRWVQGSLAYGAGVPHSPCSKHGLKSNKMARITSDSVQRRRGLRAAGPGHAVAAGESQLRSLWGTPTAAAVTWRALSGRRRTWRASWPGRWRTESPMSARRRRGLPHAV